MRHPSLLLLAALLVISCGGLRTLPVSTEHRDSVSVTYLDSTIYHIDTLWLQLPASESSSIRPSCDSSHLENDVAYSDAYVDSLGMLHHFLGTNPKKIPFPVPIPEHTLTVDRAHSSKDTLTVYKYVDKPLTWWQKFWIRAGQVLIVLTLLLIIMKGLKKLI